MMALFNFIKEVFDRTIGDQPFQGENTKTEAPRSAETKKDPRTGPTLVKKEENVQNGGHPKRRWGDELHEFFIEHLLSVTNHDPNGLTEKLTIA